MSERLLSNPVAELNDQFRKTGLFALTIGVLLLPEPEKVIQAVRDYDDFTPDNDPYGEHDFGTFEWKSELVPETVLWKIDYYDQNLEYGEDPLSPDCQRVLTVMTAEEY